MTGCTWETVPGVGQWHSLGSGTIVGAATPDIFGVFGAERRLDGGPWVLPGMSTVVGKQSACGVPAPGPVSATDHHTQAWLQLLWALAFLAEKLGLRPGVCAVRWVGQYVRAVGSQEGPATEEGLESLSLD